jgi:uncharacterized 2Fe-2S/4Fe-4S cluster protein (DUF4445 family)
MAVELTFNAQRLEAPPGASLFDLAEGAGIRVPTSCNKQGKCKECMVEVTEGMDFLSPRGPEEAHLAGDFRLSCCTRIASAAGRIVCRTLHRGSLRIERRGYRLPVSGGAPALDPAATRDGSRVWLDGEDIGGVEGPVHGLAVDLGTTTVVLRLFNLETGEQIADASFENPQRFGGTDVMARIQYDTDHRRKLLMRTVAGYLSHAIEEMPAPPHSIVEAVVVGNATMRDLFFRQSVYTIGQSPYQSVTEIELAEGRRTTTSLGQTGRRSLLPIHPRARVYGAPIISGHIGADAAACMVAVGLAQEERLVAIMDIGTNTELIVGNRHRILAASCPAGPAFEGGRISCGMPGLEGAIEHVTALDGGGFEIGVIGEGPPLGICGSGLIDLAGELLRTGQMNRMGRFTEDRQAIPIAATHGIAMYESDLNELAQAKGANVAGLHTVCSAYGITFEDIECFYLAGGFGRHLNLDAARRIGLIPNLPDDRIVQVGNAAIEGAGMILLSKRRRAELEKLVRRVEHCRLETHPDFFDFFVEGCQFKPLGALHEVTR